MLRMRKESQSELISAKMTACQLLLTSRHSIGSPGMSPATIVLIERCGAATQVVRTIPLLEFSPQQHRHLLRHLLLRHLLPKHLQRPVPLQPVPLQQVPLQ